MRRPTPKIDTRTAPDIFRQVETILKEKKAMLKSDSGWQAFEPGIGISGALISVFSHFAALITDRINRAPEKNFLAFLDLLGASLSPPQPARVPLTFSLAEAAVRAVVPEATQVAAAPAEGEKEPVVFETERELVITGARLAAAFTREPGRRLYSDHALLLPQSGATSTGEPAFQGSTRLADGSRDDKPALYLGFEAPPRLGRMPNDKINLYVGSSGEVNASARPQIRWEYSTGSGEPGWASLTLVDGTAGFTRPGIIEFLAPPDFAARAESGQTLYWVRAVLKSGTFAIEPQISSLLLNTVMARHGLRVANEVLGSSDGSKNQAFRTAVAPLIEAHRLEVREFEVASTVEHDAIEQDAGVDSTTIVSDEAGRPLQVWTRWMEVPDFYASGARDRHYVLDHLTGEVRFGDGVSGAIPRTGSGNIRMASYSTGGGVGGNKPAGAITELRTAVPYVEGVTNYIAATGGVEAETYESLVERMPRSIRHRGRAATYEDYEDLAKLASPGVARARCVRFYEKQGAGKVLLVIVPRSLEPRPVASLELKKRVEEFIDSRKSPLVELEVTGAEYVAVNVTVEIAPVSPDIADELKIAVLELLNGFLHPLIGGPDGEGWEFGRQPHDSDLYYLIEAIPGVDHITAMNMELGGKVLSEQYLIASGNHNVSCTF